MRREEKVNFFIQKIAILKKKKTYIKEDPVVP